MEDDNKDKEEQEGAAQPAAQEESGVTRNQWDGGPWPQEANGVATDEDNQRTLEATANRPQNLVQTPDSHWDSVLSRQHAQDVEDVKLQRFAQNRAVIAQMIKDRDDRENAEKAAVQAREDQFSALASLCYDPDYGRAFVDSGTLQAYNAQHQGEQGFNPITKMGRMTGGALFVERQIVDNNGRPVVEQFVDPKTGQRVQRPKVAIEAIGPKQFQARMKDFRDWQWDDVTKQFMNSGDFAKVQKSREDKARAELYQKQLDADPRLRMADTKMQADLAQRNAEETKKAEAETAAKADAEKRREAQINVYMKDGGMTREDAEQYVDSGIRPGALADEKVERDWKTTQREWAAQKHEWDVQAHDAQVKAAAEAARLEKEGKTAEAADLKKMSEGRLKRMEELDKQLERAQSDYEGTVDPKTQVGDERRRVQVDRLQRIIQLEREQWAYEDEQRLGAHNEAAAADASEEPPASQPAPANTDNWRENAIRDLNGDSGASYTFTDKNGESRTVSFAEAVKMATSGDEDAKRWAKEQIVSRTKKMKSSRISELASPKNVYLNTLHGGINKEESRKLDMEIANAVGRNNVGRVRKAMRQLAQARNLDHSQFPRQSKAAFDQMKAERVSSAEASLQKLLDELIK